MAGWISLLKKIYDSDLVDNDVPKNMNINEYIITWLIYMLKLKDGNSIINLNDFYYQYKNQRGGHTLVSTNGKDYYNIIDNIIINKNYLMDMDKNIISKFYNLLKSLCRIKLLNNNDFDINENSSYRKILSSLSTYYDNFKKYCDKNCNGCSSIPPLPMAKTTQVSAHISENTSSTSSILNTLISGLSIFSVIPAFLGIAYNVNIKELKTIIFKLYFCDPLYGFIKKYIYDYHFYISIHYLELINYSKDNI
ncbi:CIR protein PIR protein, fragment [Plasmodium vinckei vinckei]|uniref:CIR protein PIR protein n=1 Tax=Plasmodium vinckei vinckei TaxID=54757 RepID=A0A449BRY3_PLAVN|nr:CIR protein PIR protein, fragment [Plasmodium vinckei vinckei]VEV56204.1 CIR protein PIR protein, fragment [Plasmodium vinckei vinckei]